MPPDLPDLPPDGRSGATRTKPAPLSCGWCRVYLSQLGGRPVTRRPSSSSLGAGLRSPLSGWIVSFQSLQSLFRGASDRSLSHSNDTRAAITMNSAIGTPPIITDHREGDDTIAKRAHYSPPWADVSIIGIAGSSGSGKTTLSHAIVNNLNLPWVVIMSMVWRRHPEDGPPCSPVSGFVLQTPRCCLLQAGVSKRV